MSTRVIPATSTSRILYSTTRSTSLSRSITTTRIIASGSSSTLIPPPAGLLATKDSTMSSLVGVLSVVGAAIGLILTIGGFILFFKKRKARRDYEEQNRKNKDIEAAQIGSQKYIKTPSPPPVVLNKTPYNGNVNSDSLEILQYTSQQPQLVNDDVGRTYTNILVQRPPNSHYNSDYPNSEDMNRNHPSLGRSSSVVSRPDSRYSSMSRTSSLHRMNSMNRINDGNMFSSNTQNISQPPADVRLDVEPIHVNHVMIESNPVPHSFRSFDRPVSQITKVSTVPQVQYTSTQTVVPNEGVKSGVLLPSNQTSQEAAKKSVRHRKSKKATIRIVPMKFGDDDEPPVPRNNIYGDTAKNEISRVAGNTYRVLQNPPVTEMRKSVTFSGQTGVLNSPNVKPGGGRLQSILKTRSTPVFNDVASQDDSSQVSTTVTSSSLRRSIGEQAPSTVSTVTTSNNLRRSVGEISRKSSIGSSQDFDISKHITKRASSLPRNVRAKQQQAPNAALKDDASVISMDSNRSVEKPTRKLRSSVTSSSSSIKSKRRTINSSLLSTLQELNERPTQKLGVEPPRISLMLSMEISKLDQVIEEMFKKPTVDDANEKPNTDNHNVSNLKVTPRTSRVSLFENVPNSPASSVDIMELYKNESPLPLTNEGTKPIPVIIPASQRKVPSKLANNAIDIPKPKSMNPYANVPIVSSPPKHRLGKKLKNPLINHRLQISLGSSIDTEEYGVLTGSSILNNIDVEELYQLPTSLLIDAASEVDDDDAYSETNISTRGGESVHLSPQAESEYDFETPTLRSKELVREENDGSQYSVESEVFEIVENTPVLQPTSVQPTWNIDSPGSVEISDEEDESDIERDLEEELDGKKEPLFTGIKKPMLLHVTYKLHSHLKSRKGSPKQRYHWITQDLMSASEMEPQGYGSQYVTEMTLFQSRPKNWKFSKALLLYTTFKMHLAAMRLHPSAKLRFRWKNVVDTREPEVMEDWSPVVAKEVKNFWTINKQRVTLSTWKLYSSLKPRIGKHHRFEWIRSSTSNDFKLSYFEENEISKFIEKSPMQSAIEVRKEFARDSMNNSGFELQINRTKRSTFESNGTDYSFSIPTSKSIEDETSTQEFSLDVFVDSSVSIPEEQPTLKHEFNPSDSIIHYVTSKLIKTSRHCQTNACRHGFPGRRYRMIIEYPETPIEIKNRRLKIDTTKSTHWQPRKRMSRLPYEVVHDRDALDDDEESVEYITEVESSVGSSVTTPLTSPLERVEKLSNAAVEIQKEILKQPFYAKPTMSKMENVPRLRNPPATRNQGRKSVEVKQIAIPEKIRTHECSRTLTYYATLKLHKVLGNSCVIGPRFRLRSEKEVSIDLTNKRESRVIKTPNKCSTRRILFASLRMNKATAVRSLIGGRYQILPPVVTKPKVKECSSRRVLHTSLKLYRTVQKESKIGKRFSANSEIIQKKIQSVRDAPRENESVEFECSTTRILMSSLKIHRSLGSKRRLGGRFERSNSTELKPNMMISSSRLLIASRRVHLPIAHRIPARRLRFDVGVRKVAAVANVDAVNVTKSRKRKSWKLSNTMMLAHSMRVHNPLKRVQGQGIGKPRYILL